MTELRRAVHLPVLACLSATAYAGALALVTMLQSTVDSSAIATRIPIRDIANSTSREQQALESTLAAGTLRYSEMADRYGAMLSTLATVEASLDKLVGTVSEVTDSTLALPIHVSVPPLQAAPRVVRVAAPATQATTGASGR